MRTRNRKPEQKTKRNPSSSLDIFPIVLLFAQSPLHVSRELFHPGLSHQLFVFPEQNNKVLLYLTIKTEIFHLSMPIVPCR